MNTADNPRPIDPQARIGHVHLKVADLERSLRFYCGVLGFQLTQRFGTQAAFVSAGGYHHHIGLNTWESLGGLPPPPRTTGLYHVAILYPTRRWLANALGRLIAAEIPLDGPAIMASVKPFTCVILTTTAWSCIGTALQKRGPGRQKANWRCSLVGLT
jgi:catechol-2,3-dioxygenase